MTLKRSVAFLVLGLLIGVAIMGVFSGGQTAAPAVRQTMTVTATAVISQGSGLVQYCFSPGGNCDSVVIAWIDRANVSVHVMMYSFTLESVSNALIRANNRGVDVKVVMERENAYGKGSQYEALRAADVDVRLDSNSALMHDKVAIIDGRFVITGSFNWTASANERNNENLLVIDDRSWAAAYESQFQIMYAAATP